MKLSPIFFSLWLTQKGAAFTAPSVLSRSSRQATQVFSSSSPDNFYNDFEGYGDNGGDDDDDYIDTDNLGDWRTFRKNLSETGVATDKKQDSVPRKSVSKANEEVLRSQSEALSEEYINGVWSHESPMPEVGGLTLKLPLEVEIYRNNEHSVVGKDFRNSLNGKEKISKWYRKAQLMSEKALVDISATAENGQIDSSKLSDNDKEFLQIYLENQETWQEVCLVTNKDQDAGTATTLVLNRPMAFKVSHSLATLMLNGAYMGGPAEEPVMDVDTFISAFGAECAVYIGGPDEQDKPATIIHGFGGIPGAVEIAPGTKIYQGGLQAAVVGVLDGTYKPLDFRFFVGKHLYTNSMLDVESMVGKVQPVACARSIALKQCISLPKPLWHEVMELCGGELKTISAIELSKRSDLSGGDFEIDFESDDDDSDEIVDELDKLDLDEDEDDDDYAL